MIIIIEFVGGLAKARGLSEANPQWVGVVKDIFKVTNSYLDNWENVNKIP